MEISKVVMREEAKVRDEQCLGVVLKEVASFNVEFNKVVQAGLPNCWEPHGEFLSWEQYSQRLVEAKSRASLSHEKTASQRENSGKFPEEGIQTTGHGEKYFSS